MASPTNVNLEPVTFQQVSDNFYANYVVNPYDINGNVIGSQILEITTGAINQLVTLPLLSSLEPSNYELTVVNVDGGKTIEVVTSGSDRIGSFGGSIKIEDNTSATITLSIASNGVWSIQKYAQIF